MFAINSAAAKEKFLTTDEPDYSRLARRFVVEHQCGCCGALAFFFGHQAAQVFRIANDRAGVGILRRPLPRVFTETMDVAAGFARQSVSWCRREPRPPARISASVSRVSRLTPPPGLIGVIPRHSLTRLRRAPAARPARRL